MFYTHKNGICFRKIEEKDLLMLKALKDESWFGTVNTACLNMDDQKKWFSRISTDSSSLFLVTYDTESPGYDPREALGIYGITKMDSISRSCEFTHSIHSPNRNRGFGKKTLHAGLDLTFEMFNMNRVETWVLETNTAENKIILGAGFAREGVRRKAVYKCGKWLDCNLYGILRSEWETLPRIKEYGGFCNTAFHT